MQAVQATAEFRRIRALPRRGLDLEHYGRVAAELTRDLTTPAGKAEGVALWPIQAAALVETASQGGLAGIIPVGGGKTLVTWLLPTICQAKRPLLLLPANLKSKTRKAYAKLARHWASPTRLYRTESYTKITRIGSVDLLDRYMPDLIVCDEAHKLRSRDNSITKRLNRYLKARRAEGHVVVCVFLTGTLLRNSLFDLEHLLGWALQAGSPLPRTWIDLEAWDGAISSKTLPQSRKAPGALLDLAGPEDQGKTQRETARRAVQRRIRETPGVIIYDVYSCDKPLYVHWFAPKADTVLDDTLDKLRTYQELPDGQTISDPLSMHRLFGEISTGMYYRWDPRPPDWWLVPRREWHGLVRDTIKASTHSSRPLDTEAAVAKVLAGHPSYAVWCGVRDKFEPNSVPIWVSLSVVESVMAWLKAQPPTLIWVSHRAVGDTLARLTGIKYYHSKGQTETGQDILDADPRQHAICSVDSLSEGQDLQEWSHNLVLTCPTSGERLEQLLGRTHRAFQAQAVHVTFLLSCTENLLALMKAREESQHVWETQGTKYKILTCQFDMLPALPDVARYKEKE